MKMLEGMRIRLAVIVCVLLGTLQARCVAAQERDESRGDAVYVMSNLAAGNTIVVLHRDEDGTITRQTEVATGGLGSGPGPLPAQLGGGKLSPLPLESQDSLISADGRFLIAVNAGSNDISVMKVIKDGLRVTDRAPSGGIFPVSVAYNDGLVYVVNLGGQPLLESSPGTPTMTGFFLTDAGKLLPIPGSTRITGDFGSAPADVVFSPDGKYLVLAERPTNLLDVFPVHEDGTVGEKVVTPSNNPTPFGMMFTRKGVLMVTEAVDTIPRFPVLNGSTTSSYRVREDGTLETISRSVPSTQTAACWIRFSKNEHYAYVVNSPSGNVSSYRISGDGELTLLKGVAADTGGMFSAPIDEAVTPDGRYLYVDAPHIGGAMLGEVRGWKIEHDGSLTPINSVKGLPVSLSGVVAF